MQLVSGLILLNWALLLTHPTEAGIGDHLIEGVIDVLTGNKARLECRFNLGGSWTWIWTRNSTLIATNSIVNWRGARNRYQSNREGGSCVLSISAVQLADNGTYYCTISENNYHCQVELLARERAFIFDPPPGPKLIELTANSEARRTLVCTVQFPNNPEADVIFTETNWRLNDSTQRFEPSTQLVHFTTGLAQNTFTELRTISRTDASKSYSCTSYQPIPRDRPYEVVSYLSPSAASWRVDSREFPQLISGPPNSPNFVSFDYSAMLRAVRHLIASYCELSTPTQSVSARATETIRHAQFGSRQTVFCLVDASPSAQVSFEFRAATASAFTNMRGNLATLSSIDALVCDANNLEYESDPFCAPFASTHLSDESRTLLDTLLRNYVHIYELHIASFESANLGTYRCIATNDYGTSSGELVLVAEPSPTTLSRSASHLSTTTGRLPVAPLSNITGSTPKTTTRTTIKEAVLHSAGTSHVLSAYTILTAAFACVLTRDRL